jgi:hypothetical protein
LRTSHARIASKSDRPPNRPKSELGDGPDGEIADDLETSRMTVQRFRHQFAAEGLDAILHRKKATGRQYRRLDSAQKTKLLAIACSEPPTAHARWTMALLGEWLSNSRWSTRSTRPPSAGPFQKRPQALAQAAPGHSAGRERAFVAAMEDVIAVNYRPPDSARPVVCVDEGGKQLIGDIRPPLPVRVGSPAKEDSEYERHGTANLFLAFDPLGGRRLVGGDGPADDCGLRPVPEARPRTRSTRRRIAWCLAAAFRSERSPSPSHRPVLPLGVAGTVVTV